MHLLKVNGGGVGDGDGVGVGDAAAAVGDAFMQALYRCVIYKEI